MNIFAWIRRWRIERLRTRLRDVRRKADQVDSELSDLIVDCENFDRVLVELRSGPLRLDVDPIHPSSTVSTAAAPASPIS